MESDFTEMECDAHGADYQQQQDLLDQERAYIAHEAARAAQLFASYGGHPESAPALERALRTVAGLEEFNLAA